MANVIDQTRKEGDLNLVNKKFDGNKNPRLGNKKPTNLVGTRGGPRAINKMEMDKLNAMVAAAGAEGDAAKNWSSNFSTASSKIDNLFSNDYGS